MHSSLLNTSVSTPYLVTLPKNCFFEKFIIAEQWEERGKSTATLFGLISVGYHLNLRGAIFVLPTFSSQPTKLCHILQCAY